MSISTRVFLHWPESEFSCASEITDTIDITAPSGRYVDVRSFKSSYLDKHSKTTFPFQWAFAGEELVKSKTPLKIEFTHYHFDSSYIKEYMECKKNGSKLPEKSTISRDIGNFKTLPSGIREETGKMMNETTGRVETYVEHWLSIDPLKSKPDHLIQLDETKAGVPYRYAVFDVQDESYDGRFIKLGTWAQGVLWNKTNEANPIAIIRLHRAMNWEPVLRYGQSATKFEGLENRESSTGKEVEIDGVKWTCVESST